MSAKIWAVMFAVSTAVWMTIAYWMAHLMGNATEVSQKLRERLTNLQPVAAASPEDTKALYFPPREGRYQVLVYGVTGADTVSVYWLVPDRVRLHGINSPELNSRDPEIKKAAQAAKEHLHKILRDEPGIVGAYFLEVEAHGRDKYGRALLRLFTFDNKDIGQLLIEAGHATPYDK